MTEVVRVPLDEEWRLKAACKGVPVEEFYPDSNTPDDLRALRQIQKTCNTCCVRMDCLDYSQMLKEKYGVWGGVTRSSRQRIRSEANTTKADMRTDISSAVDDIACEMASKYVPESYVINDGRPYVSFLFPALRALALA